MYKSILRVPIGLGLCLQGEETRIKRLRYKAKNKGVGEKTLKAWGLQEIGTKLTFRGEGGICVHTKKKLRLLTLGKGNITCQSKLTLEKAGRHEGAEFEKQTAGLETGFGRPTENLSRKGHAAKLNPHKPLYPEAERTREETSTVGAVESKASTLN